MFLMDLPESEGMVSKAIVNRCVEEMADASRDTRLKVAKAIDMDPEVFWRSEGRSWVRA